MYYWSSSIKCHCVKRCTNYCVFWYLTAVCSWCMLCFGTCLQYEFGRPVSSTSGISQRSIGRRRPRHLVPAPGITGVPTCSSTAPVHSPSSLSMHSSGSPASQYTVAGGAAPSSQLLNGLQRHEIARSSTCRTVHVKVPAPPSKLQWRCNQFSEIR